MRLGFTLSEVLITISIIGIVAALTLPSLIQNHQKKTLEAQFKKAYAVIENVNLQMINNDIAPYDEYIADRNESKINKQINDFVSFTNGAKICDAHYSKCNTGKFFNLNRAYKTLDNKNNAHIDADAYTKKTINMPDGITIWVGDATWAPNRYYVDTNGTGKGPNRLGYDLFSFIINKNNTISPQKDKDIYNRCSFILPAHNKAYLGFGCAAYAAANENPDDTSKTYWQNFIK